ncbi:MAG TPA: twin-arginine translocase TatA/TatE family subunit [Phototrophicaceae bacterium]|nr:twin-arginine translocase TatA/TatE family subunit [Phototrophicaceae bacterium]
MMHLGPTELLIILVIVLLLFGVGRVAKIGGELGSAIASFRKNAQTENQPKNEAG